jgi:outer membrane protein OmpA-like peptidoglycan-associated protein
MRLKLNTNSLAWILSAIAVSACGATLPPKELVDARATYDRVSKGIAAQNKPDEVLTAKQHLEKAEALFEEKGVAGETIDAAYVASRKAELAEVSAQLAVAQKEKEAATKEVQTLQGESLDQARGELAHTKRALQSERAAREDAEQRAAAAMADLQRIAAVKKDDRGMVITLSGAVLFKTDKYELLPAAMVQLNQVAEALTRNSPDAKVTVEGHTDSQGSEDHNKELSLKRAQSVADYLVSRGIAKDRVTGAGIGSSRSIADNKTTEGRAQNRRVEIIVDNPK